MAYNPELQSMEQDLEVPVAGRYKYHTVVLVLPSINYVSDNPPTAQLSELCFAAV